MATDLTSITKLFPHQNLKELELDTKPDHAFFKVIHKEINANAMAIHSTRGGGIHGHLALVITPADFTTLAGVAFEVPDYPGAAPDYPPNSTGPQITAIDKAFKRTMDEFLLYRSVDLSLKSMLLACMSDEYYNTLSHDTYGYANVTTLAILQHLDTTYGTLTGDDLTHNTEDFAAPLDQNKPIEALWTREKLCRNLATAGGDAITDASALRTLLNILEQSGLYEIAIRDWRNKPDADRTYANFKPHFNKAEKERLRQLKTIQTAFSLANKAMTDDSTIKTEMSTLMDEATRALPRGVYQITPTFRMGYCHTHGLTRTERHTSATCNNPAEGHNKKATLDNSMGGRMLIIAKKGDKKHPLDM